MGGKNTSTAKDYYRLLQVHPQACDEVIAAAHVALLKKHHPDHKGADKLAGELNNARDVLLNSAKRRRFDEERRGLLGETVDRYRILDMIAEGGFGKTYRAEHILTGERVCLKDCTNVPAEFEEVLIEEARSVWDLRHYAIPVMRDLLRLSDGRLALIMSYIPGPTLEQIVKKVGHIDPLHVSWITERVLNGLQYLHFHGVVHGDVKPQNVIVQQEKHMAVLVDYGLAMVKPKMGDACRGHTEVFAPPEEIAGDHLLPESDLYSLGMTMIYALSGGNLDAVVGKRVPDRTPQPLCDFIDRLVVREVQSRPHWGTDKLCETIKEVRIRSFGNASSNLKPIF